MKQAIKVVGRRPNDPLVFNDKIRSAAKPNEIISGKTDAQGSATVEWIENGEIRFSSFGAFGRVETQWQKIVSTCTPICSLGATVSSANPRLVGFSFS